MKLQKIFTILSIPLLLTGCAKNDLSFVENPTAEYASKDTDACNFIVSYKDKTISDSERGNRVIKTDSARISCSEIDTSTIGKTKVYYDANGKMSSLTVEVKDTTAPEISLLDGVTSNNPLDYIKAIDPSGVAKLSFDGEFNPDINGDYEITVTAADNEGNIGYKSFVITVNNNRVKEEEKETEEVKDETGKKEADNKA